MWLSSGLEELYRSTCYNADVVDILGNILEELAERGNLQPTHLSGKGVTAAEEATVNVRIPNQAPPAGSTYAASLRPW